MENPLPDTISSSLPKINPKNPIILIAVLLLIISIIVSGYNLYSKNQISLPTQLTEITNPTEPVLYTDKNNSAIGKVGEEVIYQSDLDTELASQPTTTDTRLITLVKQKIASDSAILQGGQEKKLITLDNTVFNSPSKDYQKRIKLVKEVKEKIINQSSGVEGTVISIWFLNRNESPLGYEKAKEIAFEKISKLHTDVKSGKITIKQAAESVKNDSSLAEIDPAYKTNASADFRVNFGQKITSNPLLDDAIFKLNSGEVTDILTGSSSNSAGEIKETRFHFAQVTKKINSNEFSSFENWLDTQLKKYETKYN